MSVCLTAIPIRRRCSQPPQKQRNSRVEALYAIPQRESRAHYRSPPCHPRGAGNCNSLRYGLCNGNLLVLNCFDIMKKKTDENNNNEAITTI
ncbi:hypothetical protein H8356DRAFT_1431960 [Neocallimastix lanati (nom. inval.)]|nr:hypothetical protein H8356DRAFT_1431960 [Neocallimastix sp. JGI-2020a]